MITSIQKLDSLWNDSNKMNFKSLDDTFSIVHFAKTNEASLKFLNDILESNETMTSWLNDSLQLKDDEQKRQFFLLNYHDYLNKKDANTALRIDDILKVWQPILSCQEHTQMQAKQRIHKIEEGQKISLLLPLNEYYDAVEFSCPNVDWSYDDNRDLKIEGIIVQKIINDDNANDYFKLKLTNASDFDASILGQTISLNKQLTIPFTTSWKLQNN